jgi:hypothetical protein
MKQSDSIADEDADKKIFYSLTLLYAQNLVQTGDFFRSLHRQIMKSQESLHQNDFQTSCVILSN